MPNFRETLGQSKETYKISGAAKGAVLDAQKRMTVAEDSYNPVADLMFGGMGKKVEEKPKPNMRRESLTVANMPNMTNLKKLQQPNEKLTAAKKDTLQRKGNVKIIDKTITNSGTLAPEVTPGVMLTRPSIGKPVDDADKPAPKPKKSVSDRRLSITPKLPKPLPALSNTDQKMAASAMEVPSFNVQRASIVAPAGTAMLPKLVKKESSDGVLDIENKLIARVSKQKRSSFIDIGTSKQMMSKLERRSSFMVTSDGPRDSNTFKNAADRVRRMSMIMPKRNSVQQRLSTDFSSTNLGARLSLNPGSPLSRRNSIMRASTVTKAEDVDPDLHHENMTQNAEALTQEQVRAFKEAFDLFDSNGGGTIDAEELKATLDSVGIEIEQEDIEDVMMKLDEDGNGEIDFEEFLNLMTNTEMFLEAFARKKNEDEGAQEANTNRDVLLFDALSEFMKKSALKAADEIVGYYSKKFRKVVKNYNMNKGAHVVGHYADGARLIGLTEKQIYRELKRLRMYSNLTDREKNSPYAQPLHLALLKSTNKTRKIRKPRRQNSSRSVNSNRSCSKLAQKMDLEPKTKEELLEARKRRSENKERVKKRQSYRRTEIKEEQEIKRKSLVKEKIKESLMHMPTASAPRETTGIPEHRRTGKIRLKLEFKHYILKFVKFLFKINHLFANRSLSTRKKMTRAC